MRRIYVDNYRCYVNFDFRPKAKQLILGVNGTGKSILLEVVRALRGFVVDGRKVDFDFHADTLTRWKTSPRQVFELEVYGNGGTYHYTLWIDVDPRRSRVVKEALDFDKEPVALFQDEQVSLFDDNHVKTASYPFEPERSALGVVGPRRSSTKLTWFKQWLGRLGCFRIEPSLIGEEVKRDELVPVPQDDLSNFAAWYSHLTREDTAGIEELRRSLQDVLSRFDSLNVPLVGRTARILRARFSAAGEERSKKEPIEFDFGELSDGQQALIALYTLLQFAVGSNCTVCFDEPDNFLALAEIQPWLFRLSDRIEDQHAQAILISHHPELINILAPENAVIFSQEAGGSVLVEPFRPDALGKLAPAELVARGWERD